MTSPNRRCGLGPKRLRTALPVCGLALALACPAAAQPVQRDLRDLFAAGRLVEDRTGDGVVDFVPAKILVPPTAREAELVAAANVAARLGYETSALDLGLLARDDGRAAYDVPVVLIGGDAPAAAGTLAPGQGAVLPLAAGDRFLAGGVRVVGYDASGLLAAASYLAGRYPNVWGMRAATWADVAERLERYLSAHAVDSAAIALAAIVVDGRRAGVLRLAATVRVAGTGAFAAAAGALEPPAVADTAAADTTRRAGESPADTARDRRASRRDLDIQDLHRIDLTLVGPDSSRAIRLLPARPWDTADGAAYGGRPPADFTLSDLYTIRGLFRDTNQDLVPDRTEAYLSVDGADAAAGLVDVAARIGLETAGIRLPLAEVAGEDDRAPNGGLPIIFGSAHYQMDRLRREDRLHVSAFSPGEGFIELAPRAFGGRHGLVVGGGDARGVSAAADFLATRMPYLWSYGKGQYTLADVETDVRRFVQARTAGGQVALAVHTLDRWLDRLDTLQLDSLHVSIAAQRVDAALGGFAVGRARDRVPGARVTSEVHTTGFGTGREIFAEDVRFPWEVDEVRAALRDEAMPALDPGTRGRVEVRVSEPPAVRAALEREIRALLSARGIAADAYDVVVLSAYKQGYSWLEEVVLPKLHELPVARIDIAYHSLRDSREVRWQAMESETRWLQEIYPIDTVLGRALGIPDSAITFTPTLERDPIYRVRAFDEAGREILADTFDPKYVVRPFFDLFPDYEQVRVTTGWVTVIENGTTVLDRRVRTDPEAFWDHLQTETFAKIVDYMVDVQDGRPSPANAPFFDEFRVELELSEPNYRIGVDEEVISSLEALHEDIYFETLTLFDLLGGRYNVDGLQFAGRVLPYILPTGTGKPGRARIRFTGKTRAIPELSLTYRARGREPVRLRYPLSPLPIAAPKLRGIAVRAGDDGEAAAIERLLFEVAVQDSVDRWDELRARSSEAAIDRTLASTALVEGMLAAARDLHAAGLYQDAASFDRVGALRFRLTVDDSVSKHARTVDVPRTRRPASTDRTVLLARDFRPDGRRLVQWQTPIPPAENDSILARLNTFPGVDVYRVGRSFLGREIFAADFTSPTEARFVSQAKLNALKPTVFLSGRQHANEVSSTSHILRLGELLATDSAYRALLDRVNVVLHPITNPDGAQLAWEMQRTNPDFMLHAGYLGALGVDATSGANGDDPIYPESKVRPHLMETWLPDIYINMHGYPSHEWVQLFAGYSAWVRSRVGTQRSWWAPRGWFIPGFTHFEDDNEPKWEKAQFAILDSIAAAITGDTAVQALNERMYARYRKYGKQDVDNFREHFHNGMLVYMGIRPRAPTGQGINNPRITYFSTTTEAPDETARGEWLELVASAGLLHGAALVRYLAAGENEVKRETAEYRDFVVRSVFRVKPVVPAN